MSNTFPLPAAARRVVAGRYLICGLLGSGGYATVLRARDRLLGREVALKELPGGGGPPREAVAASRLNHPTIAVLYELFEADRRLYLVYELVEGRPLSAVLAGGQPAPTALLRALLNLCEALAHAHSCGVVHGDVSPANLLLLDRPAPGQPQAKLTDFGAALLAEEWGLRPAGCATPGYAAPELLAGQPPTPAADVYAAAVVIEQALRRCQGGVPPALSTALGRALATNPQERCSAAQLAEAVAAAAREQAAARTALLPTASLATPRRSRRPTPALAAVPLLCGAAAFLALSGRVGVAILLCAALPALFLALAFAPPSLAAPALALVQLPLVGIALVGAQRPRWRRALGGACCGWLIDLAGPPLSNPPWPPLPGLHERLALSAREAEAVLAAAASAHGLLLLALCALGGALAPAWPARRLLPATAAAAIWAAGLVGGASLVAGAAAPQAASEAALALLLSPLAHAVGRRRTR